MATILLIEDDTVLGETLRYNLEYEGHTILLAEDGLAGLELARASRPDLILLDVMLPRLDGFAVCRILRQESDRPIIMLTARSDEADRILGLELGANDYIVKPFSMGELLARVRAHLRHSVRADGPAGQDLLVADELRIDLSGRRVFRGDTELTLSHKEFDLLACLLRNRGRALSRDVLLEQVWGAHFTGTDRTVDVHIRWLRKKIEPDPAQPRYIRTVRGIGYRFNGNSH